jgi:hypothetical protein
MSQIKVKRGTRSRSWGGLQSWLRRALTERGEDFVAEQVAAVAHEYKRLCHNSVPEDKARAQSVSVLPGFVVSAASTTPVSTCPWRRR